MCSDNYQTVCQVQDLLEESAWSNMKSNDSERRFSKNVMERGNGAVIFNLDMVKVLCA